MAIGWTVHKGSPSTVTVTVNMPLSESLLFKQEHNGQRQQLKLLTGFVSVLFCRRALSNLAAEHQAGQVLEMLPGFVAVAVMGGQSGSYSQRIAQ